MIIAHKRFAAAGIVVELSPTNTLYTALPLAYQKDEIPAVSYSSWITGMETKPLTWFFVSTPGWAPELATLMKLVKDNWTEKRPPRIGVIAYDHPATRDMIERAPQFAPELGVEFIGYEVVPVFGLIDSTTEWLRLAGKKPDWIYLGSYGGNLVVLIKDSARLEIKKKGIGICGSINSIDEAILDIVKDDAEGYFVLRATPLCTETKLSGMKAVLEAAKEYRNWEPNKVPGMYIGGWINAQVAIEGIRLAIEKVGFENLTGRTVRDALASMNNFDTGLIPPITMGNNWPFWASHWRVYLIQRRRAVPISDWLEPAYVLPLE